MALDRTRSTKSPIELPDPYEVASVDPPLSDSRQDAPADDKPVENQRMLEETIETLLASNNALRRRNRDLRTENQRLTHAHEALDDVATMIAHDLKTPLRTVDRMAGHLKVALSGDRPNEDCMRWLQSMQYQLVGLNRLIDDLLAYARHGPADTADMQTVDVTQLLRETLTLIGLPKGVKVLIRPQSLKVTTWRIPLACILRNLLGQTVERIGSATGAIRIEVSSANRLLEVAIADNGRHEKDHTSELGLAIVRQLLDTAGGRLMSGVNKSGPGHHVRFTWPIDDKIAPETKVEPSNSA